MNRSFQLYTQKPLTSRIMRFFPVVIILLSKVSEYAREPNKTNGSRNPVYYSHSTVAGGFEVMSYTILFIPLTSFVILFETVVKIS